MGKYTKLIQKLVDEQNKCKNRLKDLQEEYAKAHFYKRINSFANPIFNVNAIVNYYTKKGSKYELPVRMSEVYAISKIIEIVSDMRNISDIVFIKRILYSLKTISEVKKDEYFNKIEDLFTFKNLILMSGEYSDEPKQIYINLKNDVISNLKEDINHITSKIQKSIEEKKNQFDIDMIEKTQKQETEKLLKIKRYLLMFSENKIEKYFNNMNDFNNFMNYLGEINFYDFDYSEIVEVLNEKEKKKSSSISENEIIKKLNKNELQLYNYIIKLLEDVEENFYLIDSKHYDTILSKNYDLNQRRKIYGTGSSLNMSVIINDIKNNLLPNIIEKKSEVINIFEYIRLIYDEYLINETRKDELEDLLNQMRKVLKENKYALDYYSQLSDSNKKIFNQILNELKIKNYETFNLMGKQLSKSLEFYKLFNILLDIEFNIDILKNVISKNIIPEDEYEDLLEMTGEVIEKYDEIEYEEEIEKKLEFVQNNEFKGKTLVGFLNFNFDNYDNDQKKILQRVLIKLFEKSWIEYSSSAHDNELKPIAYKKSNGKNVKLKASGFDVNRIRINKYRIGVIQINVCKENNEKLLKKFNLKGPFIILLEPFQILGADHNKYYEYIVYFINENKQIIDDIISKFANPETKEEDLYKIIESGILVTKEVLNKKITENEKKK